MEGSPELQPERISTVNDLYAEAREKVRGIPPEQAYAEMAQGATLVDIRDHSRRMTEGLLPNAVWVRTTVFEWRCDPASEYRDSLIFPDSQESVDQSRSKRLIIFCDQGYQSALRAALLVERFGMPNVTDIEGGFEAWRAAGLPVMPFEQSEEPEY
jgi:rhodanese-related sulfurtransferase